MWTHLPAGVLPCRLLQASVAPARNEYEFKAVSERDTEMQPPQSAFGEPPAGSAHTRASTSDSATPAVSAMGAPPYRRLIICAVNLGCSLLATSPRTNVWLERTPQCIGCVEKHHRRRRRHHHRLEVRQEQRKSRGALGACMQQCARSSINVSSRR